MSGVPDMLQQIIQGVITSDDRLPVWDNFIKRSERCTCCALCNSKLSTPFGLKHESDIIPHLLENCSNLMDASPETYHKLSNYVVDGDLINTVKVFIGMITKKDIVVGLSNHKLDENWPADRRRRNKDDKIPGDLDAIREELVRFLSGNKEGEMA